MIAIGSALDRIVTFILSSVPTVETLHKTLPMVLFPLNTTAVSHVLMREQKTERQYI
jgi:hypothetical protein